MKENSIKKIWNVWENENKVLAPIDAPISLTAIDQIASLFSAGIYYYYVLNFDTYNMNFVHPNISKILGLQPVQFSLDTLFDIMHPDDLDKMHQKELKATHFLLKNIPLEDIPHYKVSYLMRLRHTNGTYKTILHQAKTLAISGNGKIQQVITVHTDVTYLNVPFDHKISFISEKRPSYYSIETDTSFEVINTSLKAIITKREIEIIQRISEGKNASEIAESLILSIHTINTHKKNILKKTQCNNTAELMAKCLQEGII